MGEQPYFQSGDFFASRQRNYAIIALCNVVGISATLFAILAYAPGAAFPAKCAIAICIIAIALISTLPVRSTFEDIQAAARDEMPGIDGTHFLKSIRSKPYGLFINLTAGMNGLIALIQLWALFSA